MPKANDSPSRPPPFPRNRQRPYPPPAGANRPVFYIPSAANHVQQPYQPYSSNQQYRFLPRNQPRQPPIARITTVFSATTHFPPPPNVTFRCPDQRYPQYTLSSHELRQSISDFIAELLARDEVENQELERRENKKKQEGENGRGKEQDDKGSIVGGRYDDIGESGRGSDGRRGGRGGRVEGGGLKNAGKGAKVSKRQGERKKSKTSVPSGGGGIDIPGTSGFQIIRPSISSSSSLQPKKGDDGVDDKEPRVTPEIEANEGDNNEEPVDPPFKDHKEFQSKVSEEAAPTPGSRPQLTNNGWPLKPTSLNPSRTSTTRSTPFLTEDKKPKPPRPWLPPIKGSKESIANVELTPEQQDAKHWKEFEPIIELNARTPWTLPLHRQPAPKPAWHVGCPHGYEPTTLAGFPLRKAYSLRLPAAHDPNQELGRYGHWCLHEEDEWDRCVMGKCEGCLVCRPYGS